MVCVYCVSHAPMLLSRKFRISRARTRNCSFWFVLVAQLSDVLQWVWGKVARPAQNRAAGQPK